MLAALAMAACAPKDARKAEHVIFIGLDGWGSFSVENADMPNVKALMAEGCYTLQKRAVLPSSSAVNWATMFMGANPEVHGHTQWNSYTPEIPSYQILKNGKFPTVFQLIDEKYPEAEGILEDIKTKYEYANDEYTMIIPKNLLDIVLEGHALHHCVGVTSYGSEKDNRYFDRIERRETYIAFLRRTTEPNIPFYTVEFEPNGTIRQHRSYYDEEPGIEYIRGFLKEWQQAIKKNLTKEDKELAQTSAHLRQKNIDELKKNRNTRVLKGLEEDFMEVMAG